MFDSRGNPTVEAEVRLASKRLARQAGRQSGGSQDDVRRRQLPRHERGAASPPSQTARNAMPMSGLPATPSANIPALPCPACPLILVCLPCLPALLCPASQVKTHKGTFMADVPSGASTGAHEACEMRDGGRCACASASAASRTGRENGALLCLPPAGMRDQGPRLRACLERAALRQGAHVQLPACLLSFCLPARLTAVLPVR